MKKIYMLLIAVVGYITNMEARLWFGTANNGTPLTYNDSKHIAWYFTQNRTQTSSKHVHKVFINTFETNTIPADRATYIGSIRKGKRKVYIMGTPLHRTDKMLEMFMKKNK